MFKTRVGNAKDAMKVQYSRYEAFMDYIKTNDVLNAVSITGNRNFLKPYCIDTYIEEFNKTYINSGRSIMLIFKKVYDYLEDCLYREFIDYKEYEILYSKLKDRTANLNELTSEEMYDLLHSFIIESHKFIINKMQNVRHKIQK